MSQLSNRLKDSSSPYLLQHQKDPVHWQAWEESTLEYARKNNKPILLSIGYAACHWCHVMAHESFADDTTAALMNENFVNIKLDREERPDLDKIYQLSHQLLLQRPGGWPLTVFLTPDKHIPFFVGTYFPPEPRHGLPSFTQLLSRISEYYKNEGDTIIAQGEQIQGFFSTIDQRQISQHVNAAPIDKALTTFKEQYDENYGGFGGAPKFPFPSSLDFLLQQWNKTAFDDEPDRQALFMVSHTLQQMARGGVYDQVGGGFFRYSVDQAWMIPHFEKMLYDNSQLIPLYAQMFQISGDSFYKDIALSSFAWLQREMQDEDGSYFSALDADSENQQGQHQEGAFYIWTKEELEQTLELEELHLIEQHLNLQGEPNFEGEYHLHQIADTLALAEQLQTPQDKIKQQLTAIANKLLEKRNQRKAPFRDYKKLTAWNALLAKDLASSARALQNDDLKSSAKTILKNIHTSWKEFGHLPVQMGYHSHPKAAFLDDYAFLLNAIIEQLQNSWDSELLFWAEELAEQLLKEFSNQQGGFYFTPKTDAEKLLYRPLTYSDDALPSGNALACIALHKLGYLLGNNQYLDHADKTIKHCFDEISRSPQAHASMLSTLEEYLNPSTQIIIRGEQQDITQWQQSLQTLYAPKVQIYAIPNDIQQLPPGLADKTIRELTVAYICTGTQCSEPIYELQNLINSLT